MTQQSTNQEQPQPTRKDIEWGFRLVATDMKYIGLTLEQALNKQYGTIEDLQKDNDQYHLTLREQVETYTLKRL